MAIMGLKPLELFGSLPLKLYSWTILITIITIIIIIMWQLVRNAETQASPQIYGI